MPADSGDVVPLLGRGARIFRRKKKFQGATWTPEASSAISTDGVWCPTCRIRHGYMSQKLGLEYERRSNGIGWKKLWYCKLSGNVLQED